MYTKLRKLIAIFLPATQELNHLFLMWLGVIRIGLIIFVLLMADQGDATFLYWPIIITYLLLTIFFILFRTSFQERTVITMSLLVDVLFIGWFLHSHDGVMSGWVSMLLFPALVGSLVCLRRQAWSIAFCAIAAYAALLYFPAANTGMNEHSHHMQHTQPTLMKEPAAHSLDMQAHLSGMFITFSLSVALLTGFISYQAQLLRQRQQLLLEFKERQLREQQIIAFATLSANTTHRLATPVSAIALLVEELAEEIVTNEPHQQVMFQQIQEQLTRCNNVLRRMADTAKDYDPEQCRVVSLGDWMHSVVDDWWTTRNEIEYELDIAKELQNVAVSVNDNLTFAIMNYLDNAANACKQVARPIVTVKVVPEMAQFAINITDNGYGFDREHDLAQFHLGKAFVDSQTGGLGIGATLAHASIQQVGGKVISEYSDELQSFVVSVFLPLADGSS